MTYLQRLLAFSVGIVLLTGHAAAAKSEPYVVLGGDVLQITVWKEDGLDREVLVLPDGSITFPLIGTIQAQGKTPSQLQADVKQKLANLIPDASVTVAVKAAVGHTVNVIGQVARPGSFVLSQSTTVMQALSQAGGFTPYASTGAVIVLRNQNGHETSIAIPCDSFENGDDLDRDIELVPGDVVVVPTKGLF